MYSVYAFLCCALLALSTAAQWSPHCSPCVCYQPTINLRTAHCHDEKLTYVPALPNDTQFIFIPVGNIASLKSTEFDTYPHLTRISIHKNPFTVLPIGLFSKTKNLTHINLGYNKLKILNSHLFANLIYLEEVWLTSNQIAVLPDNCFFNVPKLNTISFGANHLSNININFIDNFNSLKHLYFENNPVHCDYSVCELMNRVVQRGMYMYKRDSWMPTCASPASVQNKTWAEAVGALWGAGLEHCPHPAVAEMNRTVNALQEEVHVVKELVSTGTEDMHGLKDVVMQLFAKSHALFIEELNKTMAEVRSDLGHVKSDVSHVKEELHTVKNEQLQLQNKTMAEVRSDLSHMKSDLGHVKSDQQHAKDELHIINNGQLQLQIKMYDVKDKVNVVKDGQQKLKDSVDVLMRQHEQIINRTDTIQSPNVLFKEVLHVRGNSTGRGFLQLLYSILPAPRNASADL